MPVSTPTAAADLTHPGGMRARRVFPTDERDHLDPFVVFERFYIEPHQGFTPHPHRGFEIVSYMLEGGMAHEDSMGNESVERVGDAMRITTGSGMKHSEMPAEDARCSGLQLWVNLRRADKDAPPSYREASAGELPTEELDGATVTTVVGDGSPRSLRTETTYRIAEVDDAWTWTVPEGWVGFCYVVAGAGRVDGDPIAAGEVVTAEGPASATFSTGSMLRVAAVTGVPHGEPIRQRGPFVE
ncbi:pirin family protein [Halobacteriales archaeon QS_1_68_20]|nr:MAG: pirin family protein [Halobacteriales archaeon QS_1_68_20]